MSYQSPFGKAFGNIGTIISNTIQQYQQGQAKAAQALQVEKQAHADKINKALANPYLPDQNRKQLLAYLQKIGNAGSQQELNNIATEYLPNLDPQNPTLQGIFSAGPTASQAEGIAGGAAAQAELQAKTDAAAASQAVTTANDRRKELTDMQSQIQTALGKPMPAEQEQALRKKSQAIGHALAVNDPQQFLQAASAIMAGGDSGVTPSEAVGAGTAAATDMATTQKSQSDLVQSAVKQMQTYDPTKPWTVDTAAAAAQTIADLDAQGKLPAADKPWLAYAKNLQSTLGSATVKAGAQAYVDTPAKFVDAMPYVQYDSNGNPTGFDMGAVNASGNQALAQALKNHSPAALQAIKEVVNKNAMNAVGLTQAQATLQKTLQDTKLGSQDAYIKLQNFHNSNEDRQANRVNDAFTADWLPTDFTDSQYQAIASKLGASYTPGDQNNPQSDVMQKWNAHVQSDIATQKSVDDLKKLQPKLAALQMTSDGLKIKGQELGNTLQEQAIKKGQTAVASDALSVAQNAAKIGDPATLMAIQEEKNNPGSYPQYSQWAQALSPKQLSDALDLATANRNDAAQQREVAKQEAALKLGTDTSAFATTLSKGYTSDQLSKMASAQPGDPNYDPNITPLLAGNSMTLASAQAQSDYNAHLQKLNDPAVKQAADAITMLQGQPMDPKKIESVGVPALRKLLAQEGVTDPAVQQGVVDSTVAAWRAGNDKVAMALAEHDARMAQYSAQLANTKTTGAINQKKLADLNNPAANVDISKETSVLNAAKSTNEAAMLNHQCTQTTGFTMGGKGENAGSPLCNYLTWYGDGIAARVNSLSSLNTGNTKALQPAPQQTAQGQAQEFLNLHPDMGQIQDKQLRSAVYGDWQKNPVQFEDKFLQFAQGPGSGMVSGGMQNLRVTDPAQFWPAFRTFLSTGSYTPPAAPPQKSGGFLNGLFGR